MKNYTKNKTFYFNNLREFLYGIAENHKDKTALTWYNRKGVEYSVNYTKVAADSLTLALILQERGYVNKHIAIAGENSYEWLIAFFGITASGNVAVTIDIEQPLETIHSMITCADADIVVTSLSMLPICKTLLDNGSITKLISTDENDDFESINKLCNLSGNNTIPPESSFTASIDDDATVSIVFTSGTTSISKPVVLTHKGVMTMAGDSASYIAAELKIFTSLPFYHAFGLNATIFPLFIAYRNICINGDLKTMMRDFKQFDPGSSMAVPILVETIHKMLWMAIDKVGKKESVQKLVNIHKSFNKMGIKYTSKTLVEIKNKILGNISSICSGGAHLEKAICDELNAFGILVLVGYGITECSPLVSVNRNRFYKFGSVGPVVPHLDIKIVEDEIYVKGLSVMKEYYKSPAETAAAFVYEGSDNSEKWLRTGDIGYIDKDGFLYITGRKKNLIVLKNGKKISPEEIESKLKNISLIKEVLAYGASNGLSTDDVKLAVMIYPNPDFTQNMSSYDILQNLQREIDILNETLPYYKHIRIINIREEEFDKTASKKIKRQIL